MLNQLINPIRNEYQRFERAGVNKQTGGLFTVIGGWLLGIMLLGSSTPAFALSEDVEKPVSIEANSVVFNKNAGTAVYAGQVEIKHGTLRITAERIEIKAPNNEIQTIKATGKPVMFRQTMDNGKGAEGQANLMVYFVGQKRMQLSGNASLKQGKDAFTSNNIEYSTVTGELKAGGGQAAGGKPGRVKAIFYPTNKAK